jgi:hypothetical protein
MCFSENMTGSDWSMKMDLVSSVNTVHCWISLKMRLHDLGQHLWTLLLEDGECHPQERPLSTKTTPSNAAPDKYPPSCRSCPRVTQHYLEPLPVTWGHLLCALPSVGILYNYTYSVYYRGQLQNSSHHFRIMLFVAIIFEWPKYDQ